jgi:hypothetical protein
MRRPGAPLGEASLYCSVRESYFAVLGASVGRNEGGFGGRAVRRTGMGIAPRLSTLSLSASPPNPPAARGGLGYLEESAANGGGA